MPDGKSHTQKSQIAQKQLWFMVKGHTENTDSTETLKVDFPLRAVELNLHDSGFRVNGSRFKVQG